MGLVELVETLDRDDFDILKKKFPDEWEYLNKTLAYPYYFLNSFDDYQKPVISVKKEDFFSKSKNVCPIDENIKRKKTNFSIF